MHLVRAKLAIIAVVLLAVSTAAPVFAEEVGEGMPMPDFALSDTAGVEHRLSDFKGNYVYLDFWASWCPPCLVSLPWMNEMHEKFSERGLKIIAVNVDEVWGEAERVMKKIQPLFLVLKDGSASVPKKIEIPVMPTSYLIDKEGRVLMRHTGFRMSDKAKLEQKLSEILNTPTL